MREIVSVRERYKEVLSTLATMFMGAIVSIFSIPLLVILLPVIWCDRIAELSANLLGLEIYDD